MGEVCRFRKDENSEQIYYSPNDIHAFRFTNNKYYISKEVNSKKIFLESLVEGVINMYYLRDNRGEHYYIENKKYGITELPYEEGTRINKFKKESFYQSTVHCGILKYYMQDAPYLNDDIEGIKKPDRDNLVKLARIYHKKINYEIDNISYNNELPLIKLSFESYWGILKYNDYGDYFNEFAGLVYFWAPRSSEKLNFKTGIIYHEVSNTEIGLNIYKIPLQIQYTYPSKRLRPKISYGVNFLLYKMTGYSDMIHTLSLNAGLYYKLSKKIYLSTGFNSDYTPITFIMGEEDTNFKILSYSFSFGLYFEL
jgi:hypothetical protein